MADRPVTASTLATRFRGFMPVVVDVETGGFNSSTDALLEVAAVILDLNPDGDLMRKSTVWHHVQPFPGGRLDPASLEITGIDPHHPLRPALPERDALQRVFREVRTALRASACNRAILVGHNSSFDLGFLNAAVTRSGIKRNPFHPFSSFDTVTLAGVALGQTVLSRALAALGLEWDSTRAHSALYDAERTADLFCTLVNRFRSQYVLALPVAGDDAAETPAEEGGDEG